ncbi:hypothetical protein HOLleu_03406 [Holothuria leucospilota]|uniref:Uncharacterized protein n=1 Tax=Holothuria leucospilota TaxID=206669 RepID=A0A9Q1CSJ3_HOLLE|nr:hypothetical protein HOLleu_03406 [Holothuria leucospilota]
MNKQRNKKAMTRKRILAVAVSVKNRYKPGYRNHRTFLGIGKKLTKHAITANDADELEVRKKRKDATPIETVITVKEFFHRGDNSRDLPDARSAKKVGDEVKSRKVMDLTLQSAYQKFCSEYPSINLSFSKFKKLRPPNILTMSNNKRAQCLCEYCTNLEFKLDAISRYMAQHQLGQFPLKNKHDISRMTLCPKDNGEYKKVCIDRQCNLCGIQCLKFEELVQHAADAMKWFRWETKEFDYDGGLIRRMTKVHKNGTLHQLIEELKMEMVPFSKHLFNASWQWRQYDHVSKNTPPNWVIFCMDYAENYACQSQDEAQGAHWSNVQATIHPIVASYRCEEADCDKMVTDSLFFISDDIKHCYHGVQHFNKNAIEHLEGKGIQIAKLIHFTDGAPTQYKSKVNFADVSMSLDDFGFPTEKHFFGSRHGKGPCDREIGVLKKQANLAVNARQVEIANAHDLYSFGQANLTRPKIQNEHCHEKRSFFFVKKGEIDRDRPDRTDVKPLKGTLQLHCVTGTGDPYKVYSRERSCFCPPCITGVNECQHEDLVGKWKLSDLQKQKTHTVDNAGHENRDNTEASSREQQSDLEVRDATTSNLENAIDAQVEQGLHLTAETDISIGEYVAVKLPVSQRKKSTLIVYMALVCMIF